MKYRLGIIGMGFGLLLTITQAYAQQSRTVTIIGHVYDAKTHQALFRASVLNISTGAGALEALSDDFHGRDAEIVFLAGRRPICDRGRAR